MSVLVDFAMIYPIIFVGAYLIARRTQNDLNGIRQNRIEALWVAGIAALFFTAAVLAPGGQSEI